MSRDQQRLYDYLEHILLPELEKSILKLLECKN